MSQERFLFSTMATLLALGCSPAAKVEGTGGSSSGATSGSAGAANGGTSGAFSGGSSGIGGTVSGSSGAGGTSGSAGVATGGLGGAGGDTGGTAGGSGLGGTAGSAGDAIDAGSAGAAGAGAGGDAGLGGLGGSGAGGDAGGAGAGAGGTAGAPPSGFFTEDFESGADGMAPAGWDTFIAYQKNNPQNTTSSSAYALVNTTRAHGGTKSAHFHGGASPAMITRPLPGGTNKLYVRAWVYMTRQLGNDPSQNANHETLLGIRKTSGDAGDEVRFGEIKGVIGTSMPAIGDAISPPMASWHSGPSVAANTWACIEVAFLGDATPNTLHAWADGTLVHEITSVGPDQWESKTLPEDWMAGRFTEVILGWQSFSGFDIDVWIDDIVLGTSPIGCG